jgi:hypothetical protein
MRSIVSRAPNGIMRITSRSTKWLSNPFGTGLGYASSNMREEKEMSKLFPLSLGSRGRS